MLLASTALGIPVRAQDLPKLSISLPAEIESFPIAFANDDSQNVFKDHGLSVDLVGFSNLQDRNTAILTGAIDGVMSDISSLLILMDHDATLNITSTAFDNTDGSRRYTIMTHAFSNITTLDQLLGRLGNSSRDTIGMLRKTDIEYETDRLLTGKGFKVSEALDYTDFTDLVELATLVAAGSWLSAALPEPISAYVQYITNAGGTPAVVLSEFEGQDLVPSVMAFQSQVIQQKADRIEKFYAAYQQVITTLQNTPRDQIVTVGLDAALKFFFPGVQRQDLPPGAEEFLIKYLIPQFPAPRTLLPEEYQQVADWALNKKFVSAGISYDSAYTHQFNQP